MDMVKINSSNISEIGYDEETNTLTVVFLSGMAYKYHPVTRDIYESILSAESKGKALKSLVIDNKGIKYTKI